MAISSQSFKAPSIPKLNKRNISSPLMGGAIATTSVKPKLNKSEFSFITPKTSAENLKIEAPSEKISAENLKTEAPSQNINETLAETNRILVEIQNQLALDFANRIAEQQEELKKIKSDRRKAKIGAEKDRLGGAKSGIKKIGAFGSNTLKKVTAPVASIFDQLKEFLGLILTTFLTSEFFNWLKDENNRILLNKIFNWIGNLFVPALIAFLTLKVFKWVRRLFKLGKFLIKLPIRLFRLTKKVFGKAFRLLKKVSTKLLNVGIKAGGGILNFLKKKGGTVLSKAWKGIKGAAGSVNNFIIKKLVGPFVNKALPTVPPKVRAKIASKIGGKGLAKFVPFLNTIIAIPDVISAITRGDAEGALISAASAIPIAGWGALALDIYRDVDPEGYAQNIRGGMTKEQMNERLTGGMLSVQGEYGAAAFSQGGTVGGTGTGDTVPAMLTPGEEVIKEPAANIFRPVLKDINNNYGQLWDAFTNSVENLNTVSEHQLEVNEKYKTVLTNLNNLFTVKKDTPKSPPQQGTSAKLTPPKEETEDKKSKVTPQQPSARNIGMPEKAKKKLNFVDMNLPDDNRMGQMPQLQTTATDLTIISPVNPSNPFMTVTSDFYGIHM